MPGPKSLGRTVLSGRFLGILVRPDQNPRWTKIPVTVHVQELQYRKLARAAHGGGGGACSGGKITLYIYSNFARKWGGGGGGGGA